MSAYQSGVSLLVDKSEVTVVSLLLQTVKTSHSGQYECSLNTRPRLSSRVSLRVEDTAAVDQEQVRSGGPR